MAHLLLRILMVPSYTIYLIITNPKFLNSEANKTSPRLGFYEFILKCNEMDYIIALVIWLCIGSGLAELRHIFIK